MSNRDRVFASALHAMDRDRKERGQPELVNVEEEELPAGRCRMFVLQGVTGPRARCDEAATHQLCDHTGAPLVGYAYCDEHGAEVADAYCGLGWGWTMEKIKENETCLTHND